MTTTQLGRLERIDLRTAWKREDTDFTPWLARDDNLGLLGSTLGVELELLEQEASVGPFRADLLCRDTDRGHIVVIENQLEKTDHSHLGQTLTYAAGLEAATIIWIAAKFTEEHRAALDWLNRITGEDFHFFGIEMELWRIGDSEPAPKFNLVAKPNDWAKIVRETSTGSGHLTEMGKLKAEYWRAFGTYLQDHNAPYKRPSIKPYNWHAWGMGKSYFQLCAAVNVRDKRNAVYVNMSGPDARAHYELLLQQRTEIESELGSLEWEPGLKEAKVILRHNTDTTDESLWMEQHAWLMKMMQAFESCFRPRIKDLDSSLMTENLSV